MARFRLSWAFAMSPESACAAAKRVMNMVRARRKLERLLQMAARLADVARIQQRHAVIVIILRRAEIDRGLLEPPLAHGQVQAGPLGDIALRTFRRRLKMVARLLQFAAVEQLHARFKPCELVLRTGNLHRRDRVIAGRCSGPGGFGCLGRFGDLWFVHATFGTLWSDLLLIRHVSPELLWHNGMLEFIPDAAAAAQPACPAPSFTPVRHHAKTAPIPPAESG